MNSRFDETEGKYPLLTSQTRLGAWCFALRATTPHVAFSYDPTGRASTGQVDPTSRATPPQAGFGVPFFALRATQGKQGSGFKVQGSGF